VNIVAKDRVDLLDRIGIRNGRVIEIGVWQGEYSNYLLSRDPAELWLVDPWMQQPEKVWCDWMNKLQREMDEAALGAYRKFMRDPKVKILRLFSVDAVKLFPDGYFDLAYIDANHSREACGEDLRLWYPKVKPGGHLAGHDFTGVWSGVEEAVREFVKENEISLTGVTGEKKWSSWVIRK
jgi:hypothetical protein